MHTEMKLIYIAGPYRAATVHGILENIRRAEAVALQVWQSGHAAICPHLNSAFFDGAVPDTNFLQGTITMLKHCDAVVLVTGWSNSSGTKAELGFCYHNNIPVYENITDFIREEPFDYAHWKDEETKDQILFASATNNLASALRAD